MILRFVSGILIADWQRIIIQLLVYMFSHLHFENVFIVIFHSVAMCHVRELSTLDSIHWKFERRPRKFNYLPLDDCQKFKNYSDRKFSCVLYQNLSTLFFTLLCVCHCFFIFFLSFSFSRTFCNVSYKKLSAHINFVNKYL